MSGRLLAGLLISAFLAGAGPPGAAAEPPPISLEHPELRFGAVPVLHFTHWPVSRYVALYVRSGDGRVHAADPVRNSGSGRGDLVLRVPGATEQRIWLGGTSGHVVAPRSGVSVDREAFIVLTAAGSAPDFTGLAPLAAGLPQQDAPLVDVFFQRVARAQWSREVEVHILPYSVRHAEAGPPERPGSIETPVELGFSGFSFEQVLTVTDILALETDGPLEPVRVRTPRGSGRFSVSYRNEMPLEALKMRLQAIVSALTDVPVRFDIKPGGGRISIFARISK